MKKVYVLRELIKDSRNEFSWLNVQVYETVELAKRFLKENVERYRRSRELQSDYDDSLKNSEELLPDYYCHYADDKKTSFNYFIDIQEKEVIKNNSGCMIKYLKK